MIVNSVQNFWDTVYNQYRKTVYRTVEDPKTHKQYIESAEYLYDKTGQVKQSDLGNNIDKKV
jgi:hypothetical protein